MMKKMLSLTLVVLMLLGTLASFSACSNTENNPTNDTTVSSVGNSTDTTVPETESPYDTNGYLKDSLPADLNFGGETVTMLYWEDVEKQEFFAEEQTGEIVNDAILARNNAVEDRLGVTLNYVGTKGNGDNMDNYLTVARNSYQAGSQEFDLYGTYSRTGAKLAYNSLCYNLANVNYLDLDKPWWPENLTREALFDGRLYFVSGDISTMLLHMMYAVYFNKDLFTNYNLTSPYDLVEKGEWTFDKMIEYGTNVYQDLDNNAAQNNADFYGLVYSNYHAEAFYAAAGLNFIEQDEEKILKISDDFYGEKTLNVISKLGPWLASDDVWIASGAPALFANGQALMALNRAYFAENYLRNVNFSYGIVPVPKYDTNQENYYTCMGNPVTLYSITADCKDPDRAAAVLECLGSEGYRRTTPALFEVNMKVKYSEGSTEAEMFDLLKSTTSFDLGRMFSPDLQMITDIFWAAVNANDTAWSSKTKAYQRVLDKKMETIVNGLTATDR